MKEADAFPELDDSIRYPRLFYKHTLHTSIPDTLDASTGLTLVGKKPLNQLNLGINRDGNQLSRHPAQRPDTISHWISSPFFVLESVPFIISGRPLNDFRKLNTCIIDTLFERYS